MPGQLVDVGGHRLHMYCTGSGSPTVVLEPGLGGASSDLGWVALAVARDSTTYMTAPAEGGATPPTARRTLRRKPPTYTRC